jgi:NAD(P)-dependent dehydrogenase (short-subunit alcohol dehydrogenase family)
VILRVDRCLWCPRAAVAKAGVNKYTKMLAGQLLEHNINVNCIAPVRYCSSLWLSCFAAE